MDGLADLVGMACVAAAFGIPLWLVSRGISAKTLAQYPQYALLYAAVAWVCLLVGGTFDVLVHLSEDGFYYERHSCIDGDREECYEWSAEPTYVVPAGRELRDRAINAGWLVGAVTVAFGGWTLWTIWRDSRPLPDFDKDRKGSPPAWSPEAQRPSRLRSPLHPSASATRRTQPKVQTNAPGHPAPASRRPWNKQRRMLLGFGVLGALLVAVAIVVTLVAGPNDEPGQDSVARTAPTRVPSGARVLNLQVFNNVFERREGSFEVGESVAACFGYAPGSPRAHLTLLVMKGVSLPASDGDRSALARSEPIAEADGPQCHALTLPVAPNRLAPGPYRLWVLRGDERLDHRDFNVASAAVAQHPTATSAPIPSPARTEQPQPSRNPSDTVRLYYVLLNQRNFTAAWPMLSERYRAQTTYERWSGDFDRLPSLTLQSIEQGSAPNQIVALVLAEERGTTGTQLVRWVTDWELVQQGGEWRLDQGIRREFQAVSTPLPTGTRTATASPTAPRAADSLRIGERVSARGQGDCTNVRRQPGLTTAIVTCVRDGQVYEIVAGPTEADGHRWWNTTAGGWVAETYLVRASAQAPVASRTIDDPIAFCSAVGTADWPIEDYVGSIRYVGPPRPFDTTEAVVWRCWDGKVLGCLAGGTAGACMKIDRSDAPSPTLIDFCRRNPNATSLPFAVTGHGPRLYNWACRAGAPVIAGRNPTDDIDALGYAIGPWYEIRR